VLCLAVTDSGDRLAAGGMTKIVCVYSVTVAYASSREELCEVNTQNICGSKALLSSSCTCTRAHTCVLCWLQIVELVRFSTAGNVLSLALDSAGELLVTGGEAKLLQVWNLERNESKSGAPCVTRRRTRDNRTSLTFAGAANGASEVRARPAMSVPRCHCSSRGSASRDCTIRLH
jgi:WD40 repeat protein